MFQAVHNTKTWRTLKGSQIDSSTC